MLNKIADMQREFMYAMKMQFNSFLHLAKHRINRIYSKTAYLFASILNRYQLALGLCATAHKIDIID